MYRRYSYVCVLGASLTCLRCAVPGDNDTAAWRVNFTVPLLRERVGIRDALSVPGEEVDIREDGARVGDTFSVNLTDTVRTGSRYPLYRLAGVRGSDSLGIMRLRGVPDITFKYPLSREKMPGPLPQALPYRSVDTVTCSVIDHVTFHESSEPVFLTLVNSSRSLTLHNTVVRVRSNDTTFVLHGPVAEFSPGDSVRIPADVAGKSCSDSCVASLSTVVAPGTVIHPDDTIVAILSLDGLAVEEACLVDSALECVFDFTVPLPFAEPDFRLDYLDIGHAALELELENATPIEFRFEPVIDNVWDRNYCETNGICSLKELTRHAPDTAFFKGAIAPLTLAGSVDPRDPQTGTFRVALDDARLFGRWIDRFAFTLMPVRVKGYVAHPGKRITVNQHTAVGLNLPPPSLRIDRIVGSYAHGKAMPGPEERVPVDAFDSGDLLDSLRGKLHLARTDVSLDISFKIPDATRFESMECRCVVFPTNAPSIRDTLRWSMHNIHRDTSYTRDFELGRLVNTLPDSVGYVMDYRFAPDSRLHFDSGVVSCTPSGAFIDLEAEAIVHLDLYLAWGIEDTIGIGLGHTAAAVPATPLQVRNLSEAKLSASFTMGNSSALSGILFGLGCTREHYRVLEELEESRICPAILQSARESCFIPITGKEGIGLPVRNETLRNLVVLDEDDLERVLSADSVFFRWRLIIPPAATDALHDTDHVDIDALLTLEGIQSTTGLLRP